MQAPVVDVKTVVSGEEAAPRRPAAVEGLACGFVSALSTLLSFVVTGLRPDRLREPIVNGDLFYYYATVRGLIDHGWNLNNPDLGAPYGQGLARFPAVDHTHYLIMKVLSFGSSDPVLVTNAYYLLGFPLAGACAYAFLRVVGVGRALSVPLAVSFAILPAHTVYVGHVMLSAYWVVPLGMCLVWLVATGRWDSLLASLPVGRRRLVVGSGVLVAVLVALGGAYYSLMLCTLMLLALALRWVETKAWRGPSLLLAGSLVATTLAALALSQVMLAAATAPEDVDGFVRQPGVAEPLGGKLTHLLLPWSQAPLLGGLRERYDAAAVLTSPEPTFFGIVASAGVWLCLGMLLWRAATGRGRDSADGRSLGLLAGLTGLVVLAYVTTGLGALVAHVVPELRGWNRFSIFVALTGTAAVGVGLQVLVRQLQRRRPWPPATFVMSLLVGVLVVVDQAQGFPKPLSYKVEGRAQQMIVASRAAMAQLDAVVTPADCPMAQYPHRRFPESPPVPPHTNYDELVTYLAGTDRPISYGGVKGSLSGDWPGQLDDSTAQRLVMQLAASGFCALEVMDDLLVTDRQRGAASGLTAVAGVRVARDEVNHRDYYDLRQVLARMLPVMDDEQLARIRDGALRPVRVNLDPKAGQLRGGPGQEYVEVTQPTAGLAIYNPSSRERRVSITLSVAAPGDTPVEVSVDGQPLRVDADAQTTRLTYDLAGESGITAPVRVQGAGQALLGRTAFLRMRVIAVEFDRGFAA